MFAAAGVVAACGGSTSSPSTAPGVDQPSIDTSSAAPSEQIVGRAVRRGVAELLSPEHERPRRGPIEEIP